MNKNTLHQLALMQKKYSQVHAARGLCGLSERGVHLTLDALKPMLDAAVFFDVKDREDSEIPVEFTVYREGVKFFALADFQQIKNHGLTYLILTMGNLRARYMAYHGINSMVNDEVVS